MSFEARILIQGVGVYVPRDGDQELLVLFPDQQKAQDRGIPQQVGTPHRVQARRELAAEAIQPQEVCPHRAFLQYNRASTGEGSGWPPVSIARHWVSIKTDSEIAPDFRGEDGGLHGVPPLEAILGAAGLSRFARLEPAAFPGSSFDPTLLAAGLRIDRGRLDVHHDYKAQFRFGDPNDPRPFELQYYSSVLQVYLGQVSRLEVELTPFDGGNPRTIRLQPQFETFDLWIRNFCSQGEPKPCSGHAVQRPEERFDADYVLNYALAAELPNASQDEIDRLPIPQLAGSWIHGEPIGGRPCNCAPCGG